MTVKQDQMGTNEINRLGRECKTPAGGSLVYIVRIGKHAKIGFTTNIAARLKSFMTSAHDVELLLSVPGDRTLERRLHELLSEGRIARELFHLDDRVLSFITFVEGQDLNCGLEFLAQTTRAGRLRARREDREARDRAERIKKAEFDAYCASLVAERKQRLGW